MSLNPTAALLSPGMQSIQNKMPEGVTLIHYELESNVINPSHIAKARAILHDIEIEYLHSPLPMLTITTEMLTTKGVVERNWKMSLTAFLNEAPTRRRIHGLSSLDILDILEALGVLP